MTAQPNFRFVDADNHYYEPDDCFTRHIESQFADRVIHVAPSDFGARTWHFGDKRHEHWDVVRDFQLPPGAQVPIYAGDPDWDLYDLDLIDCRADVFMNRDARLKLMDEQNVEASFMLPSIGLSFEDQMHEDVEAAYANWRSFNTWLEEDWGYSGRINGAPYISLLDVDLAIAELDRVLARGARFVQLKQGPAYGRSPAQPYFDPFWARVSEAEIPVIMHGDDSGYIRLLSPLWGEDPTAREPKMTALQFFLHSGFVPMSHMLASMLTWNLFERFPKVRLAVIESGSDWLAPVVGHLGMIHRMTRTNVGDDTETMWPMGKPVRSPLETVREHLWISPFYEEPIADLAEMLGTSHVLFGSDFPHPEGLAAPAAYLGYLEKFDEGEVRKIMRENAAGLLGMAQ